MRRGCFLLLLPMLRAHGSASDTVCSSGQGARGCNVETDDEAGLAQLRVHRANSTIKRYGGGPCSQHKEQRNGLSMTVKGFVFTNNCGDDVILPKWGAAGCVVPAKTTCKVGHAGSCTQPARKVSSSALPLCSDVGVQGTAPIGDNSLHWHLAGTDAEGTRSAGEKIEMNTHFTGEGSCLNRVNGQSHAGFTSSYRLEVLKANTAGPNTGDPACHDYGFELTIPEYGGSAATGGWDGLSCPAGTQKTGTGTVKDCNVKLCFCPGQYMKKENCQNTQWCDFVYHNMNTLLSGDGGPPLRCRSFCLGYRKGVPGPPGCGRTSRYGMGASAFSNMWFGDGPNKWHKGRALGVMADKSCLGDKDVDVKVTTCGVSHVDPDKRCTCGGPDESQGGEEFAGCPSH